MASNLEKAYKGYGKKKRSAFAKQKKAEWQGKALGDIGNTLMSAAKLYKKNVEPNLQKWKDVEAGYDALDVAEADRYKPRSFLGVPYEKMGMKPKNISKKALDKQGIGNIESGGRSYTLGDVRGLGSSLSDQSPEMKALMRDDDRSMKDFFGTELSSAKKDKMKTTSTVELDGEKMEGTLKDIDKTEFVQVGDTQEIKVKETPPPKKMTDNLEEQMNKYGSYESMYDESYGKVGRGLDKKGDYKKQSITDRLFGPMGSGGKRLKTEGDYEDFFRKKEMNQFTESTEREAGLYNVSQIKNKEQRQQINLQKINTDKFNTTKGLIKRDFPDEYSQMEEKKSFEEFETSQDIDTFYNALKENKSNPKIEEPTENLANDPKKLQPMTDIGVTSGSQHWVASQDKDLNWIREQLNVTAVSGTKQALMANKRQISFADIIQGKKSYAELLNKKPWMELETSWDKEGYSYK